MDVLPQSIQMMKIVIGTYAGNDWHRLIFLAHEKGCTPLSLLLRMLPHWNEFRQIHSGEARGHYVIDTELMTATYTEDSCVITFTLSAWMKEFVLCYKSLGKLVEDGLSWADVFTIMEWVEQGKSPLLLPGPFRIARLLERPQTFSFRHCVDGRGIRLYEVTLYRHLLEYPIEIRLSFIDRLRSEGATYRYSPVVEESGIPDFTYGLPSRGIRIVMDVPGIHLLLDFLSKAVLDVLGLNPASNGIEATMWQNKGVLLLNAPPQIVSQLLSIELSPYQEISLAERRDLPSMEDYYGLSRFERVLQEGDKGRSFDFVLWSAARDVYWHLSFDDRILRLRQIGKTPTGWDKPKEVYESDFISDLVRAANSKGLLPDGFEHMPWEAFSSWLHSPQRFNIPMQVVEDFGDGIFIVEEPGTGFRYEAYPVIGNASGGEIQSQVGRFEFSPIK